MKHQDVLSEIEKGVERVGRVIMSFPWANESTYALWCAQTFKYVSHSAPLIKHCAEHLPPGPVKDDMKKHYKEEVGHEKFAEADAKFFGLNAKTCPELKETTKIYGDIYDLIAKNPSAMFGYAMALENVSKVYGPKIAEMVTKAYKITPNRNPMKNAPGAFIILHAEVDQEHADEGIDALHRIDSKDLPFVNEVMLKTFDAYLNFLNAIQEASKKRKAA